VVLSGCATAAPPEQPRQQSQGPQDVAREIVGALPSLGLQKWAALTPEQHDNLVRAAEPFLLKWNSDGDRLALSVVLSTFSALWNALTPEPAVHCTLLENIVCY